MGAPKPPKPPKPPAPPVQEIAGAQAGEAEKKFLKGRQGALSAWLTKGQTLGGGKKLG
jgi:hypothetical protein